MIICTVCPNSVPETRIKRWPHVRTCSPACSKEWEIIDNRERMRTRGSWYRYRVTEEQFQEMLDNQNGSCAICKIPFPLTNSKMMIDHNHACCPDPRGTCGKCVRGILCQKCNIFVARVEEGLIAPALKYLDNYNQTDNSFGVRVLEEQKVQHGTNSRYRKGCRCDPCVLTSKTTNKRGNDQRRRKAQETGGL